MGKTISFTPTPGGLPLQRCASIQLEARQRRDFPERNEAQLFHCRSELDSGRDLLRGKCRATIGQAAAWPRGTLQLIGRVPIRPRCPLQETVFPFRTDRHDRKLELDIGHPRPLSRRRQRPRKKRQRPPRRSPASSEYFLSMMASLPHRQMGRHF